MMIPAIAPPVRVCALLSTATAGGETIEATSTSALAVLKLTESLDFRLVKTDALNTVALVLIELPISDALEMLSA